MYILLPPSEGKSLERGTGSFRKRFPDRVADIQPVIDMLGGLSVMEQRALYGLKSEEKASEAHAWNLRALDAPCLRAVARYTGVVYDHIDFNSLTNPASGRRRILIISALFGLVEGGAPLPPYKLSMTPWLAHHWRPINSQRLAALAKGRPVLNLLSQGYARAVDYPSLISVDFRVEGGQKAAGHFGKAIKGRFVRWVLENGVKSVRDFYGFQEDGYQFDGINFVQTSASARRG